MRSPEASAKAAAWGSGSASKSPVASRRRFVSCGQDAVNRSSTACSTRSEALVLSSTRFGKERLKLPQVLPYLHFDDSQLRALLLDRLDSPPACHTKRNLSLTDVSDEAYTWWSGAAPSLLSQQLVQCFACNHKQVQQEVSGLRQQVAQQQQHIKQLTAQHNQLASKARAQWQELEHRGVTISQLQAEVAGIHQALQHEPTKQQLLNQQSIIKQLEDELADSKQQVAAAQELRYNLGQQLLQREQQLAEQSRTIADLQQQLAAQAADQRLEEWEQQKAEQDATIADLQQQLAQQQQVLQQEQRQRALLHQQYMQLRQAHQQAAQQHAMWAQDQQVLAEQAAGLAAQQRLLAERIAQQRPVQTIAAAPGAVLSPQNGQQQQRAVPQQQGAGRATPLQVQQQPACGVSGVMLSPVPVPLAQQQSYHHEDSKPHVGPY